MADRGRRRHASTREPTDCDHTVRAFTPEGRLLFTLGTRGRPSETGATSSDYRTVRRAGPPFHYPTNLALDPAGNGGASLRAAASHRAKAMPDTGRCR